MAYVMNSMIFGAKSSPTSAIYVLNKNASEFIDSYPEAVKAIYENIVITLLVFSQ